MKKNTNYFLLLVLLAINIIKAVPPVNFFYPDDHPFRLQRQEDRDWQFSIYAESGLNVTGKNCAGEESNILQIWNKTQDALAMVRGFPLDSSIGQFSLLFNDIADDGIRGHLKFCANASLGGIFPIFRFYLPKNLTLSLTTPFYWMRVKDVGVFDLTESSTFGDLVVREELTGRLNSVLKEFGDGLTISNWERVGPGDFWLEVDWVKNFCQPRRENLTNVFLNIRGGLTLPTGLAQDVNQVLSVPFGNDHALGIVFGGEVQMTWWNRFVLGIDAEFWQLFGTSRYYRVKTDISQTDFLLLAKTKARKRWGFTQRYDIWGEFLLGCGFSFEIWYQHLKHNRDRYSFFDSNYIESIANTAGSLQEWSIHNIIFMAKYSGLCHCMDSALIPQFGLFYRKPFNGYGALLADTLGVSMAFEF